VRYCIYGPSFSPFTIGYGLCYIRLIVICSYFSIMPERFIKKTEKVRKKTQETCTFLKLYRQCRLNYHAKNHFHHLNLHYFPASYHFLTCLFNAHSYTWTEPLMGQPFWRIPCSNGTLGFLTCSSATFKSIKIN
jgi:hypothetical protein